MISFRQSTYIDCQSGLLDELPFLPAGDVFAYVWRNGYYPYVLYIPYMLTCSADVEDTCHYHTYIPTSTSPGSIPCYLKTLLHSFFSI